MPQIFAEKTFRTEEAEQSELTELKARDAFCPKGKKIGMK